MRLALVLAIVCGLLWQSDVLAADTWQAGVAKVSITPAEPMWMAGYAARTKPAEGKLTDLWAKALVFVDPAGNRGVLVTLDLIGIDRELGLAIRQQIAEKHRIDIANVMLCTSHTHSGPVVAKNLRPMHWMVLTEEQQQQVAQYATQLQAKVAQAVAEASQKLVPCQLVYGVGQATFAANRRNNKEAEFAALKEANKIVGPNDHDVPVLVVKDESGKLLGLVFGYACHATVLDSYAWCGDYPGYAQLELEQQHPEAIALFWAGCGGDQNPLPRRKVEYAQEYGHQLATAVEAVLQTKLTPVTGKFVSQYAELDLPLAKIPSQEEFTAQAGSKDRYVASRAKYWLDELAAGRKVLASYPYPIARWQLGDDVEWIFLGGEVVVDYALRLKSERRGGKTWVAGYSNDVMAYIPSRRVLNEGGYEGGGAMVYYGLPAPWSEEIEQVIVDGIKKWK